MKLQVIDKIKLYEINFLSITQLLGTRIDKKDFIIKSLEKYFSSSKYNEYEKHYRNNIRIDDNVIGRHYFKLYKISKREDLLNEIKLSKASILYKYINDKLTKYSYQVQLDKLETKLDEIFQDINTDIFNDLNSIQLTFEQKTLFDMIPKSSIQCHDGRYLEELSNYELLTLYIDLIERMNHITPSKTLVVIENIDHMIDNKEYNQFLDRNKEICHQYDYYIIVTTSINSFVKVDDELIEGINIINDEIVALPEVERLEQFIKENYPITIQMKKEEIKHLITLIAQDIGKNNIEFSAKGNILLKLINQSMCLNTKTSSIANNIENNFIKS